VVERRKDSGPKAGGFKRYTAGPADIKYAMEEYKTARTAVSATPTPTGEVVAPFVDIFMLTDIAARRIVPSPSAGFSVGFPIPHQPFVTTGQIEGEPGMFPVLHPTQILCICLLTFIHFSENLYARTTVAGGVARS
jgi:hypothetical protein